MRYLVADTETTGLGAPPKAMACEIAIIEVDAELNVLNEWETLINPGIPIEEGAGRIHKITDADVAPAPTIEQALEFIAPGGFGPVALICHNVRFDRNFFAPHMDIAAELCTLELARRIYPNAPKHQLPVLKQWLGLSTQAAHEAMGDIRTVLDLLRHLVPHTGRTFEQLLGAAAKPVRLYTMPWGQYKGMPIDQMDVDYRNWLLQQQISPDLRYTLELLAKAFI